MSEDGWAIHYGKGLKCFAFEEARALQLAVSLHGIVHAMRYVEEIVTREDLAKELSDPNVRAFLLMIRRGEGTAGSDGYHMLFGGALFTDLSAHPHQTVLLSGYASSAAGAYQFLSRTWDHLVEQYGFPDFSPQCQDEGAVALIAGRGALEDVKAGNLVVAIRKCNKEWASLPESPYGQPTRTMAEATVTYTESGGRLA